jgi:hypothetical protein
MLMLGLILLLVSCGGTTTNCNLTALNVGPPTATANHLSSVPGNQAQFSANGVAPSGCFSVQCVDCTPGVKWLSSDPVHVTLAPVTGQSRVTATCIGAASSVTIAATAPSGNGSGQTVSGTATLICQ